MNQRIRELANQCNFTDADIEAMSPGFEKFAELIIADCTECVRGVPTCGPGSKGCDEIIKEHFGVK